MCKKVNENQPSDEHGSFPKIDALMKRLLKDICVLCLFKFIDLPCLALQLLS